jgi:hypothetical protein
MGVMEYATTALEGQGGFGATLGHTTAIGKKAARVRVRLGGKKGL